MTVHQPAMLAPMFALAAWTLIVLLVMVGLRVASKLRPAEFALGESDRVPLRARLAHRNYQNLLELPLLFYVVCTLLYVSNGAAASVVQWAWIFVGLRMAHSLVHIGYNNVVHRLLVFTASNFVLIKLWYDLWQCSV
jgi:hypothetical protein